MQVIWEADTAAFANRKRAARACATCQKRKKRCNHTFARHPDEEAAANGIEKVLPGLLHKDPIRFVGDLNPESVLTDLSSRTTDTTRVSKVGTWVADARERERIHGLEVQSEGKVPSNVETFGRYEGGRRTLTKPQRDYLQAADVFRVLPKATQDALVSTYIACIDGLLPIIDGGKFLHEYASGDACHFLIQAICLVACKTEEAAPYLRLYDNGPLLDPVPFARSLHTALEAAIKADLVVDRMTRIQVLVLMHLHNDGPGGIEDSSLHLSQAIHDAWTAGLHIHTAGRQLNDQATLLWWTIYVLDKINACLGGRPVMIANRDIDIRRPPLQGSMRSQSIGVWLRLADLLDQVISFYRPTADQNSTGWETEFPSFLTLTAGADLSYLREDQRIVLEILYNTIAMLSCRAGGPTTTSYARRIQASDRIQTLVSSTSPASLPPLPLIPYAIGLALTVSYRALRDHAKEPTTATFQADLTTRCEILESLAIRWWTADAMARLGRKALHNIQNPGATRRSLATVGEEMDAEVSVCKYGPFDQPRKAGQESTAEALQMLSDAAATHGSNSIPPFSHSTSTDASHMPQMPMPNEYDPLAFEHFQDLDNLFEGFFDLRMPTVFEDPLFDGLLAAAGTGEVSVEIEEDGPLQHRTGERLASSRMASFQSPLPATVGSGKVVVEGDRVRVSEYPDLPQD